MAFATSLTNRIFVASAALAVVSIGVAVLVVNAAVTAQAEKELARGLGESAAFVDEYLTTLFDHFSREARLVADLPKLKAAVDSNDPPTVQPLADDYARQMGADLVVVTNRSGQVLALSGAARPADVEADALDGLRDTRTGSAATSFWAYSGGVLQVVSVPIWIDPALPEVLGTFSAGSTLDPSVARRFKALTNSEIAFALGGRILVSTLPRSADDALAGLLDRTGAQTIIISGDEYVGVSRALVRPPAGLAAPEGPAPMALILRSRTERLGFLRPLHTQLAATAVVAVLVAVLLSYGIALTVARPLGTVAAAMRDMSATGDLTRRIPEAQVTAWNDEDARLLATTFNAMTASIERFQREATLRERLSSLGRLSTVIAHEIRNPLMIIKASVRLLKRADAPPEGVRATIADIEEEIARLNRIVSEVLDFSRPISFDRAPADVNAVCRSAAQAVDADDAPVRVTLRLQETLPALVTDAERLRQALVNVLDNARQAAVARPAGEPPRVELLTASRVDGRLVVAVRDNGPGIAAEDLPRVFEPYFTTRRAGSGLGLAITKNIVEGLGGSVRVSSRPGEGTDIQFDFPLEDQPVTREAERGGGGPPEEQR